MLSSAVSPPAVETEALAPTAAPARLAAWLRILWEDRRYLWRGAVAGVVAGVSLAFLVPVRYRAEVRFVPEQGGVLAKSTLAGLAVSRELPGNSVSDLVGIATAAGYFVGLARSHTIENRLVDRFDLQRVYRQRLRTEARRVLENNTDLAEEKKSGIVTLSVVDGDRRRAADIATAYAEELNRRSSELNVGAAHRERVFIEGRLREVRAELAAAELSLSQFSSSNVTFDISEQAKAMLTSTAAVQGQLIAAESELQALKQIYGAENSRVLAATAKVTEYRRQLARLENAGRSHTHELPSLRQLPLIGLRYAELYRQAKIQQTVFELLTHQYEMAKIEEARETLSLRIVDPAEAPESKSFPPRAVIVVLTFALAVMAVLSWRLARRAWAARGATDPYKLLADEVWSSVQPVAGKRNA